MIATTFFQACNRMRQHIGLAVVMAGLFFATAVDAQKRDAPIDKLPRAYVGEFRWDGDKAVQNVVIRFDLVRALNSESAEATGCGAYEINRQVTKIKVRMFVNWSDLRVQILEQSPEGSASFTTDGSHRGHLTGDLQKIDAQWTGSDGKRGQLHLHAAPSAACAPATAL